MCPPARIKNAQSLGIEDERPVREQKIRAIQEFDQSFRALLEARHGSKQFRSHRIIELLPGHGAVRQMSQSGVERGHEVCVPAGADIMPIHALKLHEVEAGGRASDMREIESFDHLCCRKKFLVALAPAEPHQIIAQRLRQIAHGAISIDAKRAVAFRQFGPVGAMDERDMRHHRDVPAERLIDLHLSRRIGEMVVAANDMRHAHVVIVDDHGEHISRRAVGAQQNEIVEILVSPGDAPLHFIVEDGFAVEGSL